MMTIEDRVQAKLIALRLIYEKEESIRQQFLVRVSYTSEEMAIVLDSVSNEPEFRDWINSVTPLMQQREDFSNDIYSLIDEIKANTIELHERDKKFFSAIKRHTKERHAEATSQIPRLVEKLKQVDGLWNKIKVVFKYIPASLKESIKKERERNRELREIRRLKKNK